MTSGRPQKTQPLDVNRSMVLVVTTLGGFLVTFMTSSVNVALPLIGQEFHASAVILSWISLSYVLMSAATLLPFGRLADIYGRMRLFITSMVIYAVIAFAMAFAPSAGVLLALRALHGIGLAIGSVTSVSLVILAFPQELRGRALGLNVAGIYLGVTLGPVLGGLIVHNLGWRSLFLIVGALGLLNLVLPLWKLRGTDWREPKKGRFDYAGSVSYAVSLTMLLIGFSLLPSLLGWLLIGIGFAGGMGFVWWEIRAEDPLFPVGLLRRSRVFAFSGVATLVNYAANAAMLFLMSLYLQYNRGLNAQTAGFVLVTGSFVQVVTSPMVGRLADRVEARYVASSGMIVCVIGLLGLSFVGTATPYWYLILMLCLIGLGMALFATPNTHAIVGSVELRFVGVVSATIAMLRQAGMSFSVGLATLVLALEVGRHEIVPADYPGLLRSVRISFLIFTALCAVGVATSLVGSRKVRGDEEAVRQIAP
jgi:MFS family permease